MMEHLLGEAASKVVVHTTNYDLCRNMISKGMAAGITSDFLDCYLPETHTVRVPLEHTVEIAYGCVYRLEALENPVTKCIVKLVEEELRRCREYQMKA